MPNCHPIGVVLLPDADGTVGAITVSNEAGSVEINESEQATIVTDKKKLTDTPTAMEKDKINAMFSEVLAMQPKSPTHFILYFHKYKTDLTSDSIKIIPDVIDTIKSRNSTYISIVGHSDTAGNEDYNLTLSKRRAVAIRNLLVEKGIEQANLKITSHGEENPLIPTGDHVNEPRNRLKDAYEVIPEGEYVCLSIVDEGVGISKQDISRICEPFYTKKMMGNSGTGLGMMIIWSTIKDLSVYKAKKG